MFKIQKMNSSRFSVLAFLFFLVGLLIPQATADLFSDKQALLDFLNNISHERALNWNAVSSVCYSWVGVTCGNDSGRIIAVRLPGVGLYGQIPRNTLSRLSALQVLSLRSNGLTGPFPSDFANLKELKLLYLQSNNFSGPLPSNFSAWQNLTYIDLSFNNFNGTIPSSLLNLTQLTGLSLEHNSLSGTIPDLNPSNLQLLKLANNHLNGTIPKSLRRFPISSFAGNDLIYQNQTYPPVPPPIYPPLPAVLTPKRPRKLGSSAILGIAIGGCALVFVALALLLLVWSKKRSGDGVAEKSQKVERGLEKASSQDEYRAGDNNKLVFFEGYAYAFDLEDLLRASAEVLGKGTLGTAYKAVLEDATTVVVKRLREVIVGKRDFEQQMEMVGRIRHENVVPLRAYYYSKDEKLMVYDYFSQGSVSQLLHGKRGAADRTPLDWDTRLKISLGAARGIARIHAENAGKLVHGNIKASNIFLNSQQDGCVSDLGLTTLITPSTPPSRMAGYRAPEVIETRKASQRSDVYSFGVLLLELLTGKSPVQAAAGEDIVHLVRWVQSVVREEWTAEVFDIELMRYPNIDEEMVEMLQIAMACVARTQDQRPKMTEVVKMIEDVRRVDTGNRPSSETKSDDSSSRAQETSLASTSEQPVPRDL